MDAMFTLQESERVLSYFIMFPLKIMIELLVWTCYITLVTIIHLIMIQLLYSVNMYIWFGSSHVLLRMFMMYPVFHMDNYVIQTWFLVICPWMKNIFKDMYSESILNNGLIL